MQMLNQDEVNTSWFCTISTCMCSKKKKHFKCKLGNKTGENLNFIKYTS